ncbi:serine/threonine protein kinase [Microcoleus sp. FACHB-831]|uniref:serine/threonine protein kinase n=1 Tax=Microcoleus sp. FACHB-831 TaxID=2692827 RepID=UPI00168917E2|nr:serine/threonine-protein kinase [Microcoleus sp. FACHB-831]MBD1920319.1 serine/threonine protein kinase [Microcoleus sp. FACHB-831]
MLQPEQVIHNRYQLKQKLGQTAGRKTWLAEDLSVPAAETVVVKLLAFGDEVQWDDLKLFEREAQVLRQLAHPQIPKYRDSFSVDDRLLWFGLVQDYIPGSSLKQLLAQGKHYTEQQVRQIAIDILDVLTYLHELSPPVLHRDIKPSNLIWGEDDRIYLVDFGAVQDRAAGEGATFTVVGTYGYAPIEQFGGRAVAASDLYALGATLIHLLTGISPADLPQKDLRIQFAKRVSLNPRFVEWIDKLADPDVEKRFQTTRQALEALRSAEVSSIQTDESTIARSPSTSQRSQLEQSKERSLTPAYNSAIELHQTADELLITIPGTSLWTLLMLIPIAIALIVLGQMVMPAIVLMTIESAYILFFLVLVIVLAISAAVYWELLPTFVKLDRAEFSLYKRPFGFTVTTILCSKADIEDVFHTMKTFRTGKTTYDKRVVTIQTNRREYFFAIGLSKYDCSWLVKAIKYWLDLS